MSFSLLPLEEVRGEIRAVPSADNVKVSYCSDPKCPHLHLLLCTSDGRPYTAAVLSAEQLEIITQLAWELRTRKGKS